MKSRIAVMLIGLLIPAMGWARSYEMQHGSYTALTPIDHGPETPIHPSDVKDWLTKPSTWTIAHFVSYTSSSTEECTLLNDERCFKITWINSWINDEPKWESIWGHPEDHIWQMGLNETLGIPVFRKTGEGKK